MYCPECGVEYREGIAQCSDCQVALLPGPPPPEPPSTFDPNLELAVVLETNNRIELTMAKGLLEQAGIPYFVLGQIATLVQDIDPFLQKWVRLQVPCDREAEAKELLESLEVQPGEPLDETGEPTGEQPAG